MTAKKISLPEAVRFAVINDLHTQFSPRLTGAG